MKYLWLLLFVSTSVFAVQPSLLSWDYQASDVTLYGVTAFPIERKPEACSGTTGVWVEITQAPASARTYTDSQVTPGVTYCYRVYALGPAGKSVASNLVAKAVPFDIPAPPTNVIVK